MKSSATVVAWAAALWTTSASFAHAYLDPGTGSFFLQMLIGGIAGGLIAIKMYWSKAKLMILGWNRTTDSKDRSSA